MIFLKIPEYSIELWNNNGEYKADVSRILTSDLSINLKLNDVDEISFTISLREFEAKCARSGEFPRNLLEPYRTEVRIRHNNVYKIGTQVVQLNINYDQDGNDTVEIRCLGYLNYFKDRYITPGIAPSTSYSGYVNATYAQIARQLITDTQSQVNGNFGVILGVDNASPNQSATRSRVYDYDNQNVKDGIINLTKLEDDNFDFKFTADKVFNTYSRLGSDKPSIELVYPQNISSLSVTRDASSLYNKITGIGSGIGNERIESTLIDDTSATTYKIREKIDLYSTIPSLASLDASVAGSLAQYANVYELPNITVSGVNFSLDDIDIGDAISVSIEGSSFTQNINGLYRIIEIDVSVNKENEENITLKLVAWS